MCSSDVSIWSSLINDDYFTPSEREKKYRKKKEEVCNNRLLHPYLPLHTLHARKLDIEKEDILLQYMERFFCNKQQNKVVGSTDFRFDTTKLRCFPYEHDNTLIVLPRKRNSEKSKNFLTSNAGYVIASCSRYCFESAQNTFVILQDNGDYFASASNEDASDILVANLIADIEPFIKNFDEIEADWRRYNSHNRREEESDSCQDSCCDPWANSPSGIDWSCDSFDAIN